MMKTIAYTMGSAVAALVLLTGCATTFRPWELEKVQPGMTRQDVEHVLGAPDSVSTNNGTVYLHYSYAESYVPPAPESDPRAYRTEQPLRRNAVRRSLEISRYVVKLADDKVIDYAETPDVP